MEQHVQWQDGATTHHQAPHKSLPTIEAKKENIWQPRPPVMLLSVTTTWKLHCRYIYSIKIIHRATTDTKANATIFGYSEADGEQQWGGSRHMVEGTRCFGVEGGWRADWSTATGNTLLMVMGKFVMFKIQIKEKNSLQRGQAMNKLNNHVAIYVSVSTLKWRWDRFSYREWRWQITCLLDFPSVDGLTYRSHYIILHFFVSCRGELCVPGWQTLGSEKALHGKEKSAR